MKNTYEDFIRSKHFRCESNGFAVDESYLLNKLFDWQRAIVKWAVKKGRAALFEDCGLGKTIQQLEWARVVHEKTGGDILILAPLAVSQQTKMEGVKFGIKVNICRDGGDVKSGINITNYERLHKFDTSRFVGVVADESSILKNYAGKIRNEIITAFRDTEYRLACTATPAPNDHMELGNTAEFLGVCSRSEMLGTFFINDTSKTGRWRLKGHAKNNVFWEWLASWAIVIRKPSDIGFPDDGFILPPISIHDHIVECGSNSGTGFFNVVKTLSDRRKARRESLVDRVKVAANLINSSDKVWIAWCNLNDESSELKRSIKGAVEVSGSDSVEYKEKVFSDFANGKIKCLVTKPRIAGFGLNFQVCSNLCYVGLSDSYEQFYQSVRRVWRFGQTNSVNVHIIISGKEKPVLENVKNKEKKMDELFSGILSNMRRLTELEVKGAGKKSEPYNPENNMVLPRFLS